MNDLVHDVKNAGASAGFVLFGNRKQESQPVFASNQSKVDKEKKVERRSGGGPRGCSGDGVVMHGANGRETWRRDTRA